MLRKILLNGRMLPVPVPVTTLESALGWIEEHLLRGRQSITKVRLDGKALLGSEAQMDVLSARMKSTQLSESSKLEITVDSPVELAIQTLDTFRNILFMIEQSLKPMAVQCWELAKSDYPAGVDELRDDFHMSMALLNHFLDLVNYPEIESDILREYFKSLSRIDALLELAISHSDWQGYASLLLNKLESCLGEVGGEADRIQSLLFTHRSELILREWHSEDTGNVLASG